LEENHRGICNGTPKPFILGYEFSADVLVLPVPAGIAPADKDEGRAFCRTLGKALVVGAQEVLEIEADEIAYFQHPDGAGGWTLVFYETAPGGAGYLELLAKNLGSWAGAAQEGYTTMTASALATVASSRHEINSITQCSIRNWCEACFFN